LFHKLPYRIVTSTNTSRLVTPHVTNLYNNLSICVSPCVCPNAIYSSSFGQIWTLKVPMDFLGPGGGNKTICKVIGPEMKKKNIGDTFSDFTTYLAFHLHLCVWSNFSPPFHQAISNRSTDLEFLGQGQPNKTICKMMGPKRKKKYYWRHLIWPYYQPSISSPFVCLIKFFTFFSSSYFKSKYRFGILGSRQT
jgi:hypothetical protein